ncbi:MAG: hypothetical protein HEEMFOPI_00444 [Holosporales bacterium]
MEPLLKTKVTDGSAWQRIMEETKTQENRENNAALAINDYWKIFLRSALNNGLRPTIKSIFWLNPEGEEGVFMNRIAEQQRTMSDVLGQHRKILFRYTEKNNKRFNVTPLTLIEELLSVFEEYRDEILKINPHAQKIYDGMIKNINALEKETSKYLVNPRPQIVIYSVGFDDTEYDETQYQTLIILTSAEKAYDAGIKSSSDFYRYYSENIKAQNLQRKILKKKELEFLLDTKVFQILDEQGIYTFFN